MRRRATRRQGPAALETLPQDQEEVWEGGTGLLAAQVGERENEPPFHPEIAFWVVAGEGYVLGQDLVMPGEGMQRLLSLLPEIMRRPLVGQARRPGVVRVREPETAEQLREECSALGIRVETDAELSEWQTVFDAVNGATGPQMGYVPASPEHGAALAELFRAAAAFYRASPWQVLDDSRPLALEPLGSPLQTIGATVMGAGGENYGLVIYPSVQAMLDFYDKAVETDPSGVDLSEFPPALSMNFSTDEELPEEAVEAIRSQGWEVAGPGAYPLLLATEPGQGAFLDLSPESVILMTLALRTVTRFWEEAEPELRAEPPVIVRDVSFEFAGGEFTIRVSCPPLVPEPPRRTRRPGRRPRR